MVSGCFPVSVFGRQSEKLLCLDGTCKEEKFLSVLWCGKCLLLWLRFERGRNQREAPFVHYMEEKVLSNTVYPNIVGICVKCSAFAKLNHRTCGKEMEGGSMSVRG